MSGRVLGPSGRGQGGDKGWFLSLPGPSFSLNILRMQRQLTPNTGIIEIELMGPDEISRDSHVKDCLHVDDPE